MLQAVKERCVAVAGGDGQRSLEERGVHRRRIGEKLFGKLMRLGKNAIDATRDMSLPDALEALRAQLALAFTTEDLAEGVAAFREKREAVWKIR